MLTRGWIITQFQNFLSYISSVFGLIRTYDTMPSDETLLAMANNTIFKTKGYYTLNDGAGGVYRMTTSKGGKLIGNKLINNQDTPFYLHVNDEPNNVQSIIPVVRYGIRAANISNGNPKINTTNSYASSNTEIFNNLKNQIKICATFIFPAGRFYFASTMSNGDRQANIKGVAMPIVNKPELSNDYNNEWWDASRNTNTALIFPFLENGQNALNWAGGTIEDVSIVGTHNTYNIVFTRANIGTENPTWTETIAESGGTQIKCTGIKATKCVVKNVNVAFFYNGVRDTGSSSYYSHVFAYKCHYGYMSQTDTKWRGIYGWHVHTLFSCRGSLVSAIQLRCDNCVHLIELNSCANINIIDADGDYCIDSLIVVQRESGQSPARGINIIGLHGRANMDKVYNITQLPNGVDVRDLTDTTGYGLIHIKSGGSLSNSRIVLNSIGNSGRDSGENDNHRTPNILLTYGAMTDATRCINNTFVLANSTGIDSGEGLKKVLQLKTNDNNRVDTAKDTYYVEGYDVLETHPHV